METTLRRRGTTSHSLFRGAVRAAVLVLGCVRQQAAAQPVAVPVDSSVTDHAVYSALLTSCHGARAGEQVALSDYDGAANGGAFQVLVISTYWTGCSPGRHDAAEWGQIAETLRSEFPGQVAFLTSLKGSSSCTSWGTQYLGNTPDSVSLLSDTNQVLHVGLFEDNPQYVIIDKAMVVRERFGSTGLDVTSIRTSVATYLAEADPVVDCVGAWSTCSADCSDKVYTVETEPSDSGNPCDAADGATLACAAGEGDCPPNVDCAGAWSECTELCEIASVRTWAETAAASGQGAACPAPSNCEPGEGDCSDCVLDVCGVCGGTGHGCPQLATTTVIQGAVSLSGFVYAMKTQEIPLGSVELRQRVSTEISGLDGDPSTLSIDADCATCAIRRLQIRAAAADLASVPLASVNIVDVGRRRLENRTGNWQRRLQTTTVELEITCTDDVSRSPAFESADTFGAAFIQAMIDVTPDTIAAAGEASSEWTDQEVTDAMITIEGLQSVVATALEYETTIFCNVRQDLHDRFGSPSFVSNTLSNSGVISADSISRVVALCAPAAGLQQHVEIVASAAHGLRNPRDLQFNPAHPNMLWVANNDTDDLTIIDMGLGVSSAMTLRDRAPFHYMERISSLSFDSRGFFATCQESRNSYNDLMVPNDFMGPTLYDGSFSELVNSRAQPCDVDDDSSTCYFTHIDMLHETPVCMGIAHDNEQVTPFGHVYWLFDGMNGTLNRFDFQEPHGPGSLDHSRASIRRFSDVELTAVPGVPGHIMMDPHARVLYIADTGAGRIVRVDPDSGRFLRNARREFSIYSSMEATFEYSIYGCTSQDVFATGIDQPSGLFVDGLYVYVGEHGTGQVLVFEKSTGRRVSQVQTGAEGLFGLEMDGNGQLWYVDGPGNQVGRVVVDVGCPAAEAGDVATSSSVSWPAFECTSQVVDDTDEDRERYHHEAFLNTHNVSGAMSLDYSTMDASECASVNFDVLLMEGFICHVCLPNPCTNGGRCVHHDGVYTFGGFSCDCDGTGYDGDICDVMQSANFVAAELHLDLSIEAVSGGLRDTFISNFRQDVAALAQVEPSQVVVDDIRPGSVVVSFRIVSAAPGSPATSPSAGLDFLQQSLARAARLDRVGVEIDSSVLVITAHVDEAGNPVPAFRDVGHPADQPSSHRKDDTSRLVIALVAGTVLGVLVGLVCCSMRRKGGKGDKDTRDISVEPKLSQLQHMRTTPPSTPDLELQAPRVGEKSDLILGIVNARVTVNGTHEFKVRWADGRDSWVDKTAVPADQLAKYEARKAGLQHTQWRSP